MNECVWRVFLTLYKNKNQIDSVGKLDAEGKNLLNEFKKDNIL